MIQLSLFTQQDFERFISWIDSPELLVTIAGNYFSYPLTVTQLQAYLNDENSFSFNITDENENKIIGHAELFRSGNNNFKIDKLILDKSSRGKSLCQPVMQDLIIYAFAQLNAETVELNVFDWNKAAIRCYEKAGFNINPTKTSLFKVGDKSWAALSMLIKKNETVKVL